MQLVSITIMDLVAYGGAGIGIGLAICGAAFWGLNPIAAVFLCLVSGEFFLPISLLPSSVSVPHSGSGVFKREMIFLPALVSVWRFAARRFGG